MEQVHGVFCHRERWLSQEADAPAGQQQDQWRFGVSEGDMASMCTFQQGLQNEGAEDEIWAVTHITEDDELEGEVGQDEKDVVSALLELAQWECISVEEQ